jgi:hypothetical protein
MYYHVDNCTLFQIFEPSKNVAFILVSGAEETVVTDNVEPATPAVRVALTFIDTPKPPASVFT